MAKFMCHAGDDDFWINVRRKYHRRIYARIKGVRLILALPTLPPIVILFWLKSLRVAPVRMRAAAIQVFTFGFKLL
jgi:hypothetical protein